MGLIIKKKQVMSGFKYMGITKTKVIIVFVSIIIIWSASYIIHLYETQDSFKVENIAYKRIDTVEIFNGGLKGDMLIISNIDSILKMNSILLRSKISDGENARIRSTTKSFAIILHFLNNKPITLYLYRTYYCGDIVRSGDYYYHNTPLLNLVISKFNDSNNSNLN